MTIKHHVLFLLMAILVFASNSYSQQADTAAQRALADSVMNSFKWHVTSIKGGSLMSLDIPYTFDGMPGKALLKVSKTDKVEKPDFISLTLPSTVDRAQGVFLAFTRTSMKDGKWSMELVPNSVLHVSFGSATDTTFTVSIPHAIVPASGGASSTDIFTGFLKYDNLLVMFFNNGEHKTLGVPLSIFREEYQKLP